MALKPAVSIRSRSSLITFAAPTGGYQLQIPDGWASTVSGDNVRFVDKFGGVDVTVTSAAQAPTAAAAPQPSALLLSEGAVILPVGAAVGTALGLGIAQMLVTLLSGVFDPAPKGWSFPGPTHLAQSFASRTVVTGALYAARVRPLT